MHCLLWFLPIFLLPLPAVSPFMSVFFLFAYAVRIRPCAYCSVIVLGLLISTCSLFPPETAHTSIQQQSMSADGSPQGRSGVSSEAAATQGLRQQSRTSSGQGNYSSCWLDMSGSSHLSSANASSHPAASLGWLSRPTLRAQGTLLGALRERWAERRASQRGSSSSGQGQEHARQNLGHGRKESETGKSGLAKSNGIFVGFGDVGFKLKLFLD